MAKAGARDWARWQQRKESPGACRWNRSCFSNSSVLAGFLAKEDTNGAKARGTISVQR